MDNKRPLPELLSPAQDMDALVSAISAGANAIYFGTDLFNARMRANNFSLDDARTAIRLCHAHGVKAFVTLNIEIYDKEIPSMLEYVSALYEAGVDALIVADFGVMALLRELFPDLEIHASTQASAHNLDGVRALYSLGCKRVVVARELDKESIKYICDNTDAEIEMFVHGAHCMSMSGQCLMSYAMGGRSGNRGECAQPCRLPYTMECGMRSSDERTPQEFKRSEERLAGGSHACDQRESQCGMENIASECLENSHTAQCRNLPAEALGRNLPAEALGYPLSLKDMSLSGSITEIIDTGASSLKIEGRMKSADYVGGVTRIWRDLLDRRQNATQREISALSSLFSRQGFTDGYFKNKINNSMLGVRSEENKEQTKAQIIDTSPLEKPKIDIHARFFVGEDAKITLTQEINGELRQVSVKADIVEVAQNAPMSEGDIIKNLSKLGSTPYQAGKITVEKDDNIIIRISSLNALRREAVDALLGARKPKKVDYVSKKPQNRNKKLRTAVFSNTSQIPEDAGEYFDRIYVPPYFYDGENGVNGVCFPPIVLDREWKDLISILETSRSLGAKYALVTNIGQIKIAKEMGFTVACDFRFNAFNRHTTEYLYSLGVENVILSPELSLPQARDIVNGALVAYGKFPVMTTFKCIRGGRGACNKQCSGYLSDRTGAKMFFEGEYGHHTVIYNSVPIYMADKAEQLAPFSCHFIFSDESAQECESIITAYKNGTPTSEKIRRIKQ